jgi:hypothetical protein
MRTAMALGATLLAATSAFAQTTGSQTATAAPQAAVQGDAGRPWSFEVLVNTYLVPESSNFAQPIVTADRKWLHLETRYNYEAQKTGSFWAGVNFSGGDTVEWAITPMFGGVVGDTDGVAPGYRGSLTWRKLEFYSEGEWVFDAGDSTESFFYNWSELSWAPVEWFRFGLVTERTRAYQTDRDIQRGLLFGVSYKQLSFTTYVFNPDDAKPTWVLGAGISF